MALATAAELVGLLRRHALLELGQAEELAALQANFSTGKALAAELLGRGWLTPYQANLLLQGRGNELLLGSYVLLERLGEGGMGAVFKARHRTLGRIVALKLIRKERLAHAGAVKRFRREIRAAAQLNHPNIVLAFDADEANGGHFFTMEFVEGTDLNRLVRKQGPLPVATACEYIRQAALGLQHAYERGLVHRDIKPDNLLLTVVTRTVKILDMGLARVEADSPGDSTSTLTQEGMVMGTPDYIAPEQALRSHEVDIRADLYSLGCTLYFLLSGRPPFPGGSVTEKLLRHQLEEPQPLESLRSDVPREVAAVVRKLMAKKPQQRYQTPAELAAVLASGGRQPVESAIPRGADAPRSPGSEDTLIAKVTGQQQRRQTERRRLLLLNAGGGVVLLGLLGVVVLLIRGQTDSAPRPTGPAAVAAASPPEQQAFDAWREAASGMPAEEQVEAVRARLRLHNPGFDGKLTPTITGGVVTGLSFLADEVTDLSPLRALPGLTSLQCDAINTRKSLLSDLSPLKGLPLDFLSVSRTAVVDLRPLSGMPLTRLNVGTTSVTDLSLLRGLRLVNFHCGNTGVTDLSPLQGMPLTSLQVHNTRVSDLTPLRESPLSHLNCGGTPIADLAPLAGQKKLAHLSCNDTRVTDLGPLRGLTLSALNCEDTKVSDLGPLQGMPLTNLQISRTRVGSLTPLRGMSLNTLGCLDTPVCDLSPLRDMPLADLRFGNAPVADLAPLAGMNKLATLHCTGSRVTDLGPLRGLPLTNLHLANTPVADLGPLSDVPSLVNLSLDGTAVTDLAPLAGLKRLSYLSISGARVTDLRPLRGVPLNYLIFAEVQPGRDAAPLRDIKTLKELNSKPVSDVLPAP